MHKPFCSSVDTKKLVFFCLHLITSQLHLKALVWSSLVRWFGHRFAPNGGFKASFPDPVYSTPITEQWRGQLLCSLEVNQSIPPQWNNTDLFSQPNLAPREGMRNTNNCQPYSFSLQKDPNASDWHTALLHLLGSRNTAQGKGFVEEVGITGKIRTQYNH